MSDPQIVETPQVETTTTETVVETPKETFDQTFDRVAAEAFDGKRGPDGKFQPKVVAPGAPDGTQVPGSPQAAVPDPAPPVIEAPQSLPADVKAKWSTLPPDVQKYWAGRESEIHQKFTTDGERLKSYGALEEVIKPLESRLKQVNAPAPEYFRRLAAADQLLASDGIRGLQQIAQMYGIDIRAAAQTGNQPGPQPQVPNVEQIVDQRVQRVLLEQRVEEKAGEIDKFKAALVADEQPDFDKLEPTMAALAQAHPKWTLDQLYKAARKVDADTSAKDEAKAKADALKAAEEGAKKKAAQDARLGPLGKRPGSTPAGPIKGKTMWDTMDRVGAEVLARE